METETLSPDTIRSTLDGFTGGDVVYKHWLGLQITEGAKFLADACGAYWLLDIIASYQIHCRRDPMLAEFQIWTLRKLPASSENMAIVECWRDTDDRAFFQLIPYTDFPLGQPGDAEPAIKLYCENGVICLPAER